ncbi:MAG: discoidin domain-containing protein [Clostridia bacterium]|jgi:hypothetical protein
MCKSRVLILVVFIAAVAVFLGACDSESNSDGNVKPTVSQTPKITAAPTVTNTPSPTPNIGNNVALYKKTQVSSTVDESYLQWGWGQEFINDGTLELSFTSAVKRNMDSPDVEEWIIIDLEKEYSIHLVILYPRQDNGRGFPEDYQIDVSSDNETWETVYTKTEDKGSEDEDVDPREIELEAVSARYIRLLATKLTDVPDTSDGYLLQMAEMEVYSFDEE